VVKNKEEKLEHDVCVSGERERERDGFWRKKVVWVVVLVVVEKNDG